MSSPMVIIPRLLASYKFTEAKKQLKIAEEDGAMEHDIKYCKEIILQAKKDFAFYFGPCGAKRPSLEKNLEENITVARKYLEAYRECGLEVWELEKKIEIAEYLQIAERHLELVQKLLAQEYHDVTEIHCLTRGARSSLDLAKIVGPSPKNMKQITVLEKNINAVEMILAIDKNIELAQQFKSKWFLEEAKKCFQIAKLNIPHKRVVELENKIDALTVILHQKSNKSDDAEYLLKGERHIDLAKDLLAQDYHDLTEIYRLISKARGNLNLAKTVDLPSEQITNLEKEIKAVEMIVGTEKNIALAQQCNPKRYLQEAKKYIGLAKQYDIPDEKVEELQSKIDDAASKIQTEFNAQDKGHICCHCTDTKITREMTVQTENDSNYTLQNNNISKLEQQAKAAKTQFHSEILVDPAKSVGSAQITSKRPVVPDKIALVEKLDMSDAIAILENLFENKPSAHAENQAVEEHLEHLLTHAEKCSNIARKALTEGHVEIAMIIALISKKLFPEADFSLIMAEIFAATSQKSSELTLQTDSTDEDYGYDISKPIHKPLFVDNEEGEKLPINFGNIDMTDLVEIEENLINIAEGKLNKNAEIAPTLNEMIDNDDTDANTFNHVSEDNQNGIDVTKQSSEIAEALNENNFDRATKVVNKKIIDVSTVSASAMKMKSYDIFYPGINEESEELFRKCLEIACTAFEQHKLEKCKRFLNKAKTFDDSLNIERYLIYLNQRKVKTEIEKEQKRKAETENVKCERFINKAKTVDRSLNIECYSAGLQKKEVDPNSRSRREKQLLKSRKQKW